MTPFSVTSCQGSGWLQHLWARWDRVWGQNKKHDWNHNRKYPRMQIISGDVPTPRRHRATQQRSAVAVAMPAGGRFTQTGLSWVWTERWGFWVPRKAEAGLAGTRHSDPAQATSFQRWAFTLCKRPTEQVPTLLGCTGSFTDPPKLLLQRPPLPALVFPPLWPSPMCHMSMVH